MAHSLLKCSYDNRQREKFIGKLKRYLISMSPLAEKNNMYTADLISYKRLQKD